MLKGTIKRRRISCDGYQPLFCIRCQLMTNNNAAVVICCLAMPPVQGQKLGLYGDCCLAGAVARQLGSGPGPDAGARSAGGAAAGGAGACACWHRC
jgi:hypothetical protein